MLNAPPEVGSQVPAALLVSADDDRCYNGTCESPARYLDNVTPTFAHSCYGCGSSMYYSNLGALGIRTGQPPGRRMIRDYI